MLFDWLVTGGILASHPATSVRCPKHVIKRGKTPLLTTDQARALIDCVAQPLSPRIPKYYEALKIDQYVPQ
jgi:hypothetical protein